MADRGELRWAPTAGVSRRVVLGSGLGAAALLGVGSAVATVPAVAAAPSARRIAFRCWAGPDFAQGSHSGTRATQEGLVLAGSVGQRVYTDPFPGGVTRTYDTATWTSPAVSPGFGLTQAIASWDADTPDGTWVEVSVGGTTSEGFSGWFVVGRWCSNDPAQGGTIHRCSVDGQSTALARMDTDTLSLLGGQSLTTWSVLVTLLRPVGATTSPTVRLVGAVASALPAGKTVPVSPPGVARGVTLNVPALSQEVHRGHYPEWNNGGEAWCSATSSAMVLGYWGTGPTGADVSWVTPWVDSQVDYAARNVFDYTYSGCGNWPFNTAYAARFGLRAFVTRLRSLSEAEGFIKAGIPLIVSVSFSRTELTGAGYGTSGHLMVIVGFTANGDVVVNDPASHLIASNAQVRTVYQRAQFENVWIPRSGGTAYVIHPPDVKLPQAPREANWPVSSFGTVPIRPVRRR